MPKRSQEGRRGAGPRSVASGQAPTGADSKGGLEEHVTALLSKGDVDAAATAIIERHGPAVLDYLRSWLRNDDAAAEAFSWFTEHVWSGLRAYRADASVRTWVYRIAHNAAVDMRKQA